MYSVLGLARHEEGQCGHALIFPQTGIPYHTRTELLFELSTRLAGLHVPTRSFEKAHPGNARWNDGTHAHASPDFRDWMVCERNLAVKNLANVAHHFYRTNCRLQMSNE